VDTQAGEEGGEGTSPGEWEVLTIPLKKKSAIIMYQSLTLIFNKTFEAWIFLLSDHLMMSIIVSLAAWVSF